MGKEQTLPFGQARRVLPFHSCRLIMPGMCLAHDFRPSSTLQYLCTGLPNGEQWFVTRAYVKLFLGFHFMFFL